MRYKFMVLTFASNSLFLIFGGGQGRVVAGVWFLIKSIRQLLTTLAGFVVSLKVS